MGIAVLTLESRPDRLAAFMQRWDTSYDISTVVTQKPHWESYRGIWQSLIEDTLVLEDDAIFRPAWREILDATVANLPDDWDLLYLGGEHLFRPIDMGNGLAKCKFTFRTHAIYVRQASVERMLALTWPAMQHWDMRLAYAMKSDGVHAYAMSPWVAGQAAGISDISRMNEPERWWDWTGPPPGWPGPYKV